MRKVLMLFCIIVSISVIQAQHRTKVKVLYAGSNAVQIKLEKNISQFLTELNMALIKKTKPEFNKDIITPEAVQRVLSLWQTSAFKCSETDLKLSVINLPGGKIELRGIPFIVQSDADSVQSEEGVVILNAGCVIEDLYFGLENQQYRGLLNSGVNVTDFRRRQVILGFVENFRTAYNRKDIEYIENVFSDNALIIVGQVIRAEANSADFLEKNLGQEKVRLIRYTKEQYLQNLKECFSQNKYIKVGFNNIEIIQHRKFPYIYGVPLEQSWVSSKYHDNGYLFLLISFKEENKPLILVRSWQQKEFTEKDSVISLGDFEIIE